MRLDILQALNTERAARRAAIVVTDVATGAQRFVAAADVAADPLREVLGAHLRSGKSGMEEAAQGRVFLTVHVPSARLIVTGAVHISQALAPVAQLLGYDVTIVDPRTAFASPERFPDVKLIAAWPDVALPPARRRPLHRVRRADPRSQDRRSRARPCTVAGLLLHRRARLEEDPRPPPRAAQGWRHPRGGAGAHPCADRAADRRDVAARDRRRDHGRDHRDPAPAPRGCAGRGGRARAEKQG